MSKKPAKWTEIDDIRVETERALRTAGYNLDNPNYNERRRICYWIIRHSRLAPAFKALGEWKGEDIMKAFFSWPGSTFYRYVMWSYYIQQLCPDMLPDRGVVFDEDMVGIYEYRRDTYYALRETFYQKCIQSRNAQGAKNAQTQEAFTEMMYSSLRGNLFAERFAFTTGHIALYVVARMLRADVNVQEMKKFVADNEEELLQDFIENGYIRSLLSLFHRLHLPDRENGETIVKGTLSANDDMIKVIFGVGHDELNHYATEYQDALLRKLELMEHWEYLTGAEVYFNKENNTDEMLEELEQPEVLTSGSLSEESVPAPVMDLAIKLSRKHGPVTITSESSGLHIYIADPELLRKDGKKELTTKHLSINADKYFGLGQWDIDTHPTAQNKQLYTKYRLTDREVPCAMSMKTSRAYTVKELLAYVPIQQRHGLFANVESTVVVGNTNKRLVYDENGNLVPEWVGNTTPITQLPENHPAVEYLTSRGYDLQRLEDQFEVCYCFWALPESRGEGRYYSRLPGGMRNSPQGRIIFTVRMNGVRHGYQSRYIDKWVGPLNYFWSNEQRWELIRRRMPDGSVKEEYPPDDVFRKGFAPHKYMNAIGSERNKLLMGYDAAVAFNQDRPPGKRYCVLVEGPLDAARIGPPALALLGKSLSVYQAEAIRKEFTYVLTVMDNDTAGRQGIKRIHTMLEHNPIIDIQLPEGVKDVGELTYEEAEKLIEPHIPKL